MVIELFNLCIHYVDITFVPTTYQIDTNSIALQCELINYVGIFLSFIIFSQAFSKTLNPSFTNIDVYHSKITELDGVSLCILYSNASFNRSGSFHIFHLLHDLRGLAYF